MEALGASQVPIPGGQAPPPTRIRGHAGAVGIKFSTGVVEVRAILVRLPSVEPGRLDLQCPRENPRGQNPEGDVGAVLPVMGNGGQWIVGRRWPVREGRRANRGLADGGEVE